MQKVLIKESVMVKKDTKNIDFNIDTEEMAKAGLQFGHKTSKIHPKMEPYLYGTRNSIHVIDLEKTKEKFNQALEFISELIKQDKVLLVVGTKIQSKNLVKEFALECKIPYVNERWLGGTFTNFEVMGKRISHFKDLEEKKSKGELEKYTKKEKLEIDQQLDEFERKFGGIKNLTKLPDAVFILSMEKDDLVVKEARSKNVKIIGISDTDTDPSLADFVIPANDDALSSIKYMLAKTKEVILKSRGKTKKEK